MSEKQKSYGGASSGHGHPPKPVPMKLFSSWEVDRTPSNCIPRCNMVYSVMTCRTWRNRNCGFGLHTFSIKRLCSLTLIRLVVTRPLPTTEASSVIIAVKMAGSRRTLRSNEIPIPESGLINTDLELHFSLQYPHFLKREENRLLIMLQRRKKYKNRTILGYKTLAEGAIDMALVLQRSYLDLELGLSPPDGGNKENNGPIAKLTIMGIASQPVDELDERKGGKASGLRRQLSSPLNPTAESTGKVRSTPGHDFSDEEDDFSSHSSDSPQDEILRKNSKSHPHNKNLKQKIVNLLKKFKQTEEGQRNEAKSGGPVADIEELFEELDGLSDSEPDADTLSVGSFPKPVLPPFFASSRSLVQYIDPIPEKSIITSDERGESDSWTEPDQPSGESPKLQLKSSAVTSPANINVLSSPPSKKMNLNVGTISEQLAKMLPPDDTRLPDLIVFVSLDNGNGGLAAGIFSAIVNCSPNAKVLGIEADNDLKIALPHIAGKLQKFCNNNAKPPPPLNIAVVGTETFLSAVCKHYVASLTSRPNDQIYYSFVYAPFNTGGSVWRLLCQSDPQYIQTFNDYTERGNAEEIAARIISYCNFSKEKRYIVHLPIAEAMITYKYDSDESSQVFVPFITEVRVSVGYFTSHLSSSAGHGTNAASADQDEQHLSSSPPSPPISPREEPLELQVDFWKGTVKSSVKAQFRSLTIQRTQDNALSISYVLKEQKKQKIMRLGKKKERESDAKNLTMDGISRLVCLSKSQIPIKLYVDGAEWPGVKFFQVSAQWQSQVKNLPLLVSTQGKGDSV